ncbi:hypothetical protein LWC34_14110 [Kibdelosporangium philippinense]|uniref:Uncharacterized protein n=1 Tax=Kibdelosporangium philippinense TaxID=211113 RepID=A0ABS8ZAW7_9PSEU|nr:hypothetical protein [Kibdelosporangium philippinense]MCE7003955.1 hypothetical protein [Kibdelosporangium philippinense]
MIHPIADLAPVLDGAGKGDRRDVADGDQTQREVRRVGFEQHDPASGLLDLSARGEVALEEFGIGDLTGDQLAELVDEQLPAPGILRHQTGCTTAIRLRPA